MQETQGALTIVAPILERERPTDVPPIQELRDELAAMNAQIEAGVDTQEGDATLPLRDVASIHYARLVIAPADPDRNIPASLVLSTNYDPPEDAHIEQLRTAAGGGLDRVFRFCVGYPENASRRPDAFRAFMKRHSRPYGAFHVSKRFYSVQTVLDEERLRQEIEKFLDDEAPWGPERNVLQEVRDFVRGRSDLRWAIEEPAPAPTDDWKRQHYLEAGFVYLLGLPAIAIALIATSPLLYVHEFIDAWRVKDRRLNESAAAQRKKDLRSIRRFADQEDHHVTNQLSDLSDMKRGLLRQFTLRSVFTLVDWLANIKYYKGDLGGIPSIHFARWVFIDRGRRLLFMSNYDGSWESYLGDFVDQQSTGLTAVWSNTRNFPKTRGLIFEGAADEQAFKQWAREQQIETGVWYAAYPNLSVPNVLRNALIRRGLRGLDAGKLDAWRRLF